LFYNSTPISQKVSIFSHHTMKERARRKGWSSTAQRMGVLVCTLLENFFPCPLVRFAGSENCLALVVLLGRFWKTEQRKINDPGSMPVYIWTQ
jgi:hypothetical protein